SWAWSNNAALCARDYLTGGSRTYDVQVADNRLGIGISDSQIDDSYSIDAANACDEPVTVPLPILSGSLTWTNGSIALKGLATSFLRELVVGDFVMDPDGAMHEVTSVTDDFTAAVFPAFSGVTVSGAVGQFGTTGATSTTQARFTIDGQVSCADTFADTLNNMLAAMNGKVSWAAGKYRIHAGAYSTPLIEITADDVLDSVAVQTHPQGEDVYNAVAGTFFDETRGWQQSSFPTRQNATYQDDDNGQYTRTIALPLTRSSFRAQRLANVLLQLSRNKTSITFNGLSPKAMKIGLWDTFFVTIPEYGWSEQIFRCSSWKFLGASGLVSITGTIENADAYADMAVEEYEVLAGNSYPSIGLKIPDAPTGLTASSYPGQIVLTVAVGTLTPGSVVELYESTSSSPFSGATKIQEGAISYFVLNKSDSTTRYYWVRVRDLQGNFSEEFPTGSGLAAAAITPGVLSAAVDKSSVTTGGPGSTQTTPAVTVTPHGGTPAYTYAWVWLTGGANLSIGNASAASTSFTGSGMTQGNAYSGVAQCTVTDALGQTTLINVSVEIACETTLTATCSPTSLSLAGSSATTQTTGGTTAMPSGGS